MQRAPASSTRDLVRAGRRRAFAGARGSADSRTAMRTWARCVVEQPGEQLVLVREMALTRLLNLTLRRNAVRRSS